MKKVILRKSRKVTPWKFRLWGRIFDLDEFGVGKDKSVWIRIFSRSMYKVSRRDTFMYVQRIYLGKGLIHKESCQVMLSLFLVWKDILCRSLWKPLEKLPILLWEREGGDMIGQGGWGWEPVLFIKSGTVFNVWEYNM